MGEATYYAKIHFKTAEDAERALAPVTAFIQEGQKAADWWQDHRDIAPAAFWPQFETAFPLITEYLKETHLAKYGEETATPLFGGDNNNRLAGLLDFGGEEDEPAVHGSAIAFSAYVWHFADWDPWLDFMVKKHGAERQKNVSDEYADLLNLCD